MSLENGNISVSTENIFPIIKKWLYSEKDIFIRELVSNANDAITKLIKLSNFGEATVANDENYKIVVEVDKDYKTIKVIDNGIGMTLEEVKKYINQIAFSGAKDFLEKYKDKADESQIIGHFGLGFYSSFMVADKVIIDTKSFVEGEKAVRWESEGGTTYSIGDSSRRTRGTTITLFMSEDSQEYIDEFKMREVLKKYFSFLPFEVYLEVLPVEVKEETKKDDAKVDEKEEEKKPEPLNDTTPLWNKDPKECTDEEYKEFYKKVFMDFNEPLFWIHLNMDYPVKLKGILYFPKLKHEFETMEGQIKLYYNQVFVADNIKEVIPEFLLLLKGCIDCPDLPLNVSRSFLQADGYVNKISAHVTKKVADKLKNLFEEDREQYSKYWVDINPFVKYGCIKETKFYDKVKDVIIYKTINDTTLTMNEYNEKNKEKNKDVVYYVSDEKQQSQYIKMFKEHEMDAVILSSLIDSHFMQFLEGKETSIKFNRIDANISDSMKDTEVKDDEEVLKAQQESLEKLFKDSLGNQNLKVKVESLKAQKTPGIILLEEQSRRMQEMSRMFGGMDMSHMFPKEETLILNNRNTLIQAILNMKDNQDKQEDIKLLCQHIFDLAQIGHKQLEAEDMTKFIERSNYILEKVLI